MLFAVGGLGLNLTSADTLVFVEHDWNPMKDLQVIYLHICIELDVFSLLYSFACRLLDVSTVIIILLFFLLLYCFCFSVHRIKHYLIITN